MRVVFRGIAPLTGLQALAFLTTNCFTSSPFAWLVVGMVLFYIDHVRETEIFFEKASERIYSYLHRNYTEIRISFQFKPPKRYSSREIPKLSTGNNSTLIHIRNRWQINIYIPGWTIFFISFIIPNQLTSTTPISAGGKINS